MATAPHRRYTAADVRAFPDDGNRYEVVHGELLVSPAPRHRHQAAFRELFVRLYAYLKDQGLQEGLLSSPADISWSDDTLVQPDIFVVASAETAGEWAGMQTLLLVIEILSPSTARADRLVKRRLYQEQGIPVYWIVDVAARQVEIWTPGASGPVVEGETLRWRHPEGAGEFVVDVPELMGRA